MFDWKRERGGERGKSKLRWEQSMGKREEEIEKKFEEEKGNRDDKSNIGNKKNKVSR